MSFVVKGAKRVVSRHSSFRQEHSGTIFRTHLGAGKASLEAAELPVMMYTSLLLATCMFNVRLACHAWRDCKHARHSVHIKQQGLTYEW